MNTNDRIPDAIESMPESADAEATVTYLPAPDLSQSEWETLQMMASAIIAQQTALTEEEAHLQQRSAALEQQERQLADHLDERRHQLVELQEQLREARVRLRQEREQFEAERQKHLAEALQLKKQAEAEAKEVRQERQRLWTLRKKFLTRWKKHWADQRRRAEHERKTVEAIRAELLAERQRIEEARKRFHGAAELEKRQLQQQREQLTQEQQTHRETVARQTAELRKQHQELTLQQTQWKQLRETVLAEVEVLQKRVNALRAESEGLETRIVHSRQVLNILQKDRKKLEQAAKSVVESHPTGPTKIALSGDSIPMPPADLDIGFDWQLYEYHLRQSTEELQRREQELIQISVQLEDQRLALAQQVAELAEAKQRFTQEQSNYAAELQTLALHTEQREADLLARSRWLQEQEERLRSEADSIRQQRSQLEAWQARLTIHEVGWQGERDREWIALEQRRERLADQENRLAEMCQEWAKQRAAEVAQLREELARFVEVRENWAKRLSEHEEAEFQLQQERKKLTEQMIALERARQEFLSQVEDPTAIAKKIERLERRLGASQARLEAEYHQRRTALLEESAWIQNRFRELSAEWTHLASQQQEVQSMRQELERMQLVQQREASQLREQQAIWEAQRSRYEQELLELRDEIERLAGVMMLETLQPLSLPTSLPRAA